jgi:predicted PhzF superfamily epimerase YddE/YHI9
MRDLHVLRVFCGPDGGHGNPLGVVLDGPAVDGEPARQHLAALLGLSETVFVDDAACGVIDIYTPSTRLLFAGHPTVGTSWLLRHFGGRDVVLRPPAGTVATWQDGEFAWITGRSEWITGRRTRQHGSAREVDLLPLPAVGGKLLYAWAWQDEARGMVRARSFPRRGDGIDEDEATGAAAMLLTAELKRPLIIQQGRGSQILTTPGPDGAVHVGGRVVLDEIRSS